MSRERVRDEFCITSFCPILCSQRGQLYCILGWFVVESDDEEGGVEEVVVVEKDSYE